jgi:hypothetical protein
MDVPFMLPIVALLTLLCLAVFEFQVHWPTCRKFLGLDEDDRET